LQVPECDWVTPLQNRRQEQQLGLQVRGEEEQVGDLAYPRSADPAEPGDVGIVLHDAVPDERLDPDR
jgi:hypothetical protein